MTNTFGAGLRAARNQAGLTQRQLANGIMSVSHLSLLERGLRQPSVETAQSLTERLGEGDALAFTGVTRLRPTDRMERAQRALLQGELVEAEHLATLIIRDAGHLERREQGLRLRAEARERMGRMNAALDDLGHALDLARRRDDDRAFAKIAINCARLRLIFSPTAA